MAPTRADCFHEQRSHPTLRGCTLGVWAALAKILGLEMFTPEMVAISLCREEVMLKFNCELEEGYKSWGYGFRNYIIYNGMGIVPLTHISYQMTTNGWCPRHRSYEDISSKVQKIEQRKKQKE